MYADTLEMVGRLLLAALLGGVLGWEREARGKPAGLRTNMMIALGAAAFTLLTLKIDSRIGAAGDAGQALGDPMRVVQGIIQGIGFLGAGAIIQSGGAVKGMTTASAIWVVAAIGAACGIGYYALAVSAAVVALIILSVIGYLEKRVEDMAKKED